MNNIYNNIKNIDIQELALKIYNKNLDLDFLDYEQEQEQELNDIKEGLEYLKTIALNEYNKDYFRTLIIALNNMEG